MAMLKPAPPTIERTPRSLFGLDITDPNGGEDAELKRLSTQALDLMSKLKTSDDESKRLEKVIAVGQREIQNLQAQLAQAQREAKRETSSLPSTSQSARPVTESKKMAASPQKGLSVNMKILVRRAPSPPTHPPHPPSLPPMSWVALLSDPASARPSS